MGVLVMETLYSLETASKTNYKIPSKCSFSYKIQQRIQSRNLTSTKYYYRKKIVVKIHQQVLT